MWNDSASELVSGSRCQKPPFFRHEIPSMLDIWKYPGWWWLEHEWILTVRFDWEYLGCHHPNWRSPSFFRGVGMPVYHQPVHNIIWTPCWSKSLKWWPPRLPHTRMAHPAGFSERVIHKTGQLKNRMGPPETSDSVQLRYLFQWLN